MKKILLTLLLLCCLNACTLPARINAQERLFPNLSLEFLGEYQLPKQNFRDTIVGGLSGITYDRQLNQFYAVSDDRKNARFYTFTLDLDGDKLQKVNLKDVTFLKNLDKQAFAADSIDPEGIALSPRRTLFISSEGNISQGIAPFIGEFKLETGEATEFLRIPERYLPNTPDNPPRGIENNQGFESLTLGVSSTLKEDPFRVFSAVESPLKQDSQTPENNRLRFLHYLINPIGFPVLVAEHLYLLEPTPSTARNHGLVELLALPKEGSFLSLERTFSLAGFSVKIFQVVNASATDTSRVESFAGDITNLQPLQKKLLSDLGELGIELDNLEGMTWGPRFADGSQSLLLVSDDNFQKSQVQQFLLFRLLEK